MTNIFKKLTDRLGITNSKICKKCGEEKREHGWYDSWDCLNEFCSKFYYRNSI